MHAVVLQEMARSTVKVMVEEQRPARIGNLNFDGVNTFNNFYYNIVSDSLPSSVANHTLYIHFSEVDLFCKSFGLEVNRLLFNGGRFSWTRDMGTMMLQGHGMCSCRRACRVRTV